MFNTIASQGRTHDDIDGLFGVIRRSLVNRSWETYAQLEALVQAAFVGENLGVPVIVRFVPGAQAYDKFLLPHIDKKLSNFSRQHDNINPGMHGLRCVFTIYDLVLLYNRSCTTTALIKIKLQDPEGSDSWLNHCRISDVFITAIQPRCAYPS